MLDFVTALFLGKDRKIAGLRVFGLNGVYTVHAPFDDGVRFRNLCFENGIFKASEAVMGEFPAFDADYPSERAGGKAAWIYGTLGGEKYRLISAGGNVRDLSADETCEYHKKCGIASVRIENGKPVRTDGESFIRLRDTRRGSDNSVQKTETAGLKTPSARAEELAADLQRASDAYYSGKTPLMSDLEYDAKLDELRELERLTGEKYGADAVGTPVKGGKVTHLERLYSLDKTKDIDALAGILRACQGADEGVLSWKLGGLTLALVYEGGFLLSAATRGDGKEGEDVTANARRFKGIPKKIKSADKVIVTGEAIISYRVFDRINSELPDGVELYKNPRNLVSGLVRKTETTQSERGFAPQSGVEFKAFGASFPGKPRADYTDELRWLNSEGFTPVEYVVTGAGSLSERVESYGGRAAGYDFPTDGLVLRVNSAKAQEELGTTGHHPKFAMAFKWRDELKETKVLAVEWLVSRTGVITPVAVFEPAEPEGTTVKRASVHNLSILEELQIGAGDTVSVYKANMIIPQIAENKTKNGTPAPPPSKCPVCGADTEIRRDGTAKFLLCTGNNCAAKNVGRFTHFVKRGAMGIDGVSEKTAADLISAGFIREFTDFYKLDKHPEIAELPGWGKQSYNNLLYAADASRKTTLAKMIYALGIKNIGRSASEAIASVCKTVDGFITMASAPDALTEVEGIGAASAQVIAEYVISCKDKIRALASELTFDAPPPSRAETADAAAVLSGGTLPFAGLTFCITGKVNHPGNRAGLQDSIARLGGHSASSVTKNVDYLITNTPYSGSAKNKAAQALGCRVIPEAELYRLAEERKSL